MQGAALRESGITKLICEFAGVRDTVQLHGGLPPPAAFPFSGMSFRLADGSSIDIDKPELVRWRTQRRADAQLRSRFWESCCFQTVGRQAPAWQQQTLHNQAKIACEECKAFHSLTSFEKFSDAISTVDAAQQHETFASGYHLLRKWAAVDRFTLRLIF